MRLPLDTTVLVDVLRGRGEGYLIAANLMRSGDPLVTSVMNVAEIYAGLRKGEQARASELIRTMNVLPVTNAIAIKGGELKNVWARKGRTLALVDTLVAATAIEHGFTLATNNLKDFPMPELTLHPWQ